jgi:hypothetical protein
MSEAGRRSACHRDVQSGRPETLLCLIMNAAAWLAVRYLAWTCLCTIPFPGGVLRAQATKSRVLSRTLTGCDSTRAVQPDTVYLADQVDRPVRPSRLALQNMPLRLRHVIRGRSVIRFIVEPTGKIDRCSIALVEEASPEWTDSVVTQLRSSRYEPARLAGQKVAQWVEQLFIFQNDARE